MYVTCHKKKFVKTGRKKAHPTQPALLDFQDEIVVEVYVTCEGLEEGMGNEKKGSRFIRWTFDMRLGTNNTPSAMAKLRQCFHSAFYIRYIYVYVIVETKTDLKMVYYKQRKGSPWINSFAETEKLVNGEENQRLNPDNIERPNTKWTFVELSNIQVKVVLDRQPMLGTGPYPD